MGQAIKLILFVALAVVVASWLADNPGSTTFVWMGYEIEVPIYLVLIGAVALAAVAALSYRGWVYIRQAPQRWRKSREEWRRRKGYQALTRGMVAVAAGDPDEAQKLARQAENLLNDPPLTMLLSAQAAQMAGDENAARRFFEAMMDKPEMAFLGMRGRLTQALKAEDKETALAIAEKAHALRPKTEWVSTSLFDLQVRAAKWTEAGETVKQASRNRLLVEADVKRRSAILAHMRSLEAEAAGDHENALKLARKAHDLEPGFLPGTRHYGERLLAKNTRRKAIKVVEDAWGRTPHPDLDRIHRDAAAKSKPIDDVKRAQKLLVLSAAEPESHLAVAAASLRAALWGEARQHLDQAANGNPDARMCRLYAELEEQENGDTELSRAWLRQAFTARPESAWVCSHCGTVADDWRPVCDHCDGFDSMVWRRPPRSSHAALAAPATPAAPKLAAPVAKKPKAVTRKPAKTPPPAPVTMPPPPAEAATDMGLDDDDEDDPQIIDRGEPVITDKVAPRKNG